MHGTRRHPAWIRENALVSDTWTPQVNGAARTLAALQDGLSAAGHQVLMLTPDLFAAVRYPTKPGIRLAVAVRPTSRNGWTTSRHVTASARRPTVSFGSNLLMQAINPSGVMAYASHLAAALPESRLKSTDSLRYGAARGWRVGERI